jgi:DNA-binding winged helix-turn-helix (wHTH) protein
MAAGCFTFDGFALDPADRRLSRGGEPVELSSRYLDALALLLRERGRLVTKDRFMDEVWQGIPVTDEALTQCIRTLRRQLGDDAARPRFIETVPKHGYRFIAPVEWGGETPIRPDRARAIDWSRLLLVGGAGTAGGGLAGFVGGLCYGFAAGPQPEIGAASALLVLTALATAIGLAGGAGVGLGIAAAEFVPSSKWQWTAAGGMFGGLAVGAAAKLLGLDAFHLLVGHAPENITGAAEGALLGLAVGFGTWLARRAGTLARGLAWAGAAGAGAGVLIPLLGGRLLGGSLDLLARQFPDSRFRLEPIAALLGEREFGPVSQAVTSGIEGLLFGLGVAGAIVLVDRTLGARTG